VQEAAESDDRFAFRRILCEVKRLSNSHVEAARDDLFFSFPVIRRLHQ